MPAACREAQRKAEPPEPVSAATPAPLSDLASVAEAPSEPAGPAVGAEDAGWVGSSSICPAPRDRELCSGDEVWARNLETGDCCSYRHACEAPWEWATFATEDECKTSCRCADFTPSDFSTEATSNTVTLSTERVSFECLCGDGDCNLEPLDEALGRVCSATSSSGPTVVRGCGLLEISWSGGFTGGSAVFDQATGAEVGSVRWSDVPEGPCKAYVTIVGREFVCADATACDPCGRDAGASSSDLPPCD